MHFNTTLTLLSFFPALQTTKNTSWSSGHEGASCTSRTCLRTSGLSCPPRCTACSSSSWPPPSGPTQWTQSSGSDRRTWPPRKAQLSFSVSWRVGCRKLSSKLFYTDQRIIKRCRLSWLTNCALVYEPKCVGVGGGGELRGLSQWEQLYTGA